MESYKHSYKVEEKRLASLSVYNVGYQKCEPGYQWGPGVRDHFLIHHIISGKGYYVVNHTTYELQKGDTFLVYPDTEVTYYADQAEPWEYTWVGFFGSDVAAILQDTDFMEDNPILHQQENHQAIKGKIMNIYEATGNTFADAVEMTGRLYTLLAAFMKNASREPEKKDLSLHYAQKGVEYIMSSYSYPIHVEDIASYVGISRSHLFRCFQACFHQSPKDYLTFVRINQACRLLKRSDLSVTVIAKSVGFENSLYFSKAFKKIKGLSPTAYANR